MRRPIIPIFALALIAAACAEPGVSAGPGSPPDGAQAAVLTYDFQPGHDLTYGTALQVSADMSIASQLSGSSDMSMAFNVAAATNYRLSPGPESGTTEVSVTSDLSSFEVEEFTVDGQSINESLALDQLGTDFDLGELIPEVTVVIDEFGNIISTEVGGTAVPTDLLGGGLGDPTGSLGLSSVFGPAFPEEGVFVGARWSNEDAVEVPFLGDVTIRSDHEVIAIDTVGGREAFVIESRTTIPAFNLDLTDMMDFFENVDAGTAAAMGLTLNDLQLMAAEFRTMMREATMDMSFDFGEMTQTTWFDGNSGVVARMISDVEVNMKASFSGFGDDGSMDMKMKMSIDSVLADGSSA